MTYRGRNGYGCGTGPGDWERSWRTFQREVRGLFSRGWHKADRIVEPGDSVWELVGDEWTPDRPTFGYSITEGYAPAWRPLGRRKLFTPKTSSWSLRMASLEGRCDLRWISQQRGDAPDTYDCLVGLEILLAGPEPGGPELPEEELRTDRYTRRTLEALRDTPSGSLPSEDTYPLGHCLVCGTSCRQRSPLCKKCRNEYGDSPDWPAWLKALRADQMREVRHLEDPQPESLDGGDDWDDDTDNVDSVLTIEQEEADPNSLWTGKRSKRAQLHDRKRGKK